MRERASSEVGSGAVLFSTTEVLKPFRWEATSLRVAAQHQTARMVMRGSPYTEDSRRERDSVKCFADAAWSRLPTQEGECSINRC